MVDDFLDQSNLCQPLPNSLCPQLRVLAGTTPIRSSTQKLGRAHEFHQEGLGLSSHTCLADLTNLFHADRHLSRLFSCRLVASRLFFFLPT